MVNLVIAILFVPKYSILLRQCCLTQSLVKMDTFLMLKHAGSFQVTVLGHLHISAYFLLYIKKFIYNVQRHRVFIYPSQYTVFILLTLNAPSLIIAPPPFWGARKGT